MPFYNSGKWVINKIFDLNKLKLLILIDRIDSFVKREQYTIQKNYIQGLIDTIEEINMLSNIQPILFLRTDLFYSLDLSIEYDKVKDRIMYLKWKKHEILEFIVRRLISNKYIKENYSSYIDKCLNNEVENSIKKSIFSKIQFRLFKNYKKYNLDMNLYYRLYERTIKLFFSNEITHKNGEGKQQQCEFCVWLFSHFKDQNNFTNPRILIAYFNRLFKSQSNQYNHDKLLLFDSNRSLFTPKKVGDFLCLNIFMPEIIQSSYEIIQNEELKNIFVLIRDENEKKIFSEINKLSFEFGEFKKEMINLKDQLISKEQYEKLLNYLVVLGFFKLKPGSNTIYILPNLFRKELIFDRD